MTARRSVPLLLAAAVGVLAGPAGAATATATPSVPPPVPVDEVLEALPLDDVPGLVVFVVDTSGSMGERGLYPAVKSAVAATARELSPADRVSVITFDVAPRVCAAGVVRARQTTAIMKCLPDRAVGARTDFGRALDAAVAVLESDRSAVRSLVLISDGRQDPAPGSPYPNAGVTAGAWKALATRARALDGVSAYALPLAGDEGAAEALGWVFGTPRTLLATGPGDVAKALGLPRRAVQESKARQLLAPDVAESFSVDAVATPSPEPGRAVGWELTVTSPSRHVPYTLTELGIRSSGGDPLEVAGLPESVRLAPGESVTLRPTIGLDGAPAGPVDVTFSATVGTEWASALNDLDVVPPTSLGQPLGSITVLADRADDDSASTQSLPADVRNLLLAAGLLLLVIGVVTARIFSRRHALEDAARSDAARSVG